MEKITYLNTREAAKHLGLSHRTLERYRVTGEGPAFLYFASRVAGDCAGDRGQAFVEACGEAAGGGFLDVGEGIAFHLDGGRFVFQFEDALVRGDGVRAGFDSGEESCEALIAVLDGRRQLAAALAGLRRGAADQVVGVVVMEEFEREFAADLVFKMG